MADDTVEMWMDDEFQERWQALVPDEESDASRDIGIDGGDNPEEPPIDLAVVEQDLRSGLFGFTRRGSDHVVVNRALYKVDRERTVRHEKAHHRHPKDELTVRYINGDIDVENTLSFQADNPSRIGRGRVLPAGAAGYGRRDGYVDSYRTD